MTHSDLAEAVGISREQLSFVLVGDMAGSVELWDKLLWHLMIPVSSVLPPAT